MGSFDRGVHADDPKARVDRILSELLGTTADLLTPEGRAEAVRRLDTLPEEGEPEAEAEALPMEEVSPDDTRSAWEVARALCAGVQLKAALKILEKLSPLPDRDEPDPDAEPPEDFEDLKRRIRTEIRGLLDEMKGEADPDAIAARFETLFAGDDALFEELREAGNYFDRHVLTRADERRVIDYFVVRAFVAQLCGFALECGAPSRAPKGDSRVGAGLGSLGKHLRCIRDIARATRRELEAQGVTDGCGVVSLPGITFGEAPPQADDLVRLLTRSETNAPLWLDAIARDGKNGAAAIQHEVARLAHRAQAFRPGHDAAFPGTAKLAQLLASFAAEYRAASDRLADLFS